MTGIFEKSAAVLGGIALGMGLTVCGAEVQSAAAQTPRTAGEAFKNIQVLKSMPETQLNPTMNFFAASLGLRCTGCHDEEREKDTPRKMLARKMIEMTMAINKNTFNGRPVVTCYSCHRGSTRPIGLPFTGKDAPAEAAAEAKAAEAPAMPSADQVVDKYVAALGGAGAIQKISSRVIKGTVTEITGKVAPMEVVVKAPDNRMVTTHFPKSDAVVTTLSGNQNGDITNTLTGTSGWVRNGAGAARNMRPDELEAAKMEDPTYYSGRIKQLFSDLKVEPKTEKIEGHDAYVVSGRSQGSQSVKLYFDKDSGLLSRVAFTTETGIGPFVTQVDYADYRPADGAKVPYRWTVSQIRGIRFVYQVTDMQQNVPVDEASFAKPSAPAAAAR